MGAIKAGVVIVNKYCKSNSKAFAGYIDYIDRDEAVRTEQASRFDLFNDYMGNPEKTSGLFTATKRELTQEEKAELKERFVLAQDNDSLMWQTVISFDNRWLEEYGLYDSNTGVLNEDKVKELAGNAITKMLHNENLDHAVWSAAIHYNTDNIHVHAAIVEEYPKREKKLYQQYSYVKNEKNRLVRDQEVVDLNGNPVFKEEAKGKFKLKSFNIAKQYVVNEIIKEQDVNKEINQIIRDKMIRAFKRNSFLQDKEMAEKVMELHQSMPDCNRSLWNYNSNIMLPLRGKIDAISQSYLEKYHKEEFDELKSLIKKQSEMYEKAYGESKSGRNFEKSKMQDLYTRMGNSVLKTVKKIDNIDENFSIKNSKHETTLHEPMSEEDFNIKLVQLEELQKAASRGDDVAALRLGLYYLNQENEEADPRKGMEYLEQSAKSGNDRAACKLGDIYYYQYQNRSEAVKWYQEAQKKDNPYAKNQLGRILLSVSNTAVQKNWEFEKAMRELNRSFQKDYKAWKNILEHDMRLEKDIKQSQEEEI